MIPRHPRHKRPVRFNRSRPNPIQRLPFYRPSLARVGDYWRMPEAQDYVMGRELGRVCAVAFLQALVEAQASPEMAGSAHLADVVCSAIEVHGGSISPSQRGLLDGFFGRQSVVVEALQRGAGAAKPTPPYTLEQLEAALTDLAAIGSEAYALQRASSLAGLIPDRQDRPHFSLT